MAERKHSKVLEWTVFVAAFFAVSAVNAQQWTQDPILTPHGQVPIYQYHTPQGTWTAIPVPPPAPNFPIRSYQVTPPVELLHQQRMQGVWMPGVQSVGPPVYRWRQ